MKQLAEFISAENSKLLLEHIHAMVAVVEKDGKVVSWNHAFEALRKIVPSANTFAEYFPSRDQEQINSKIKAEQQQRWHTELLVDEGAKLYDCSLFPLSEEYILFIAEPVNSEPGMQETVDHLNRQVKLFRIESEVAKKLARNKQVELEAVIAQANEVTQIDALTFLINRRTIVNELQSEVIRAQRYKSPLSVSIVDIDHFKNVNDTYGHLVGDEALRQVAHQLREHIRHPDLAGRYGGEEFLILLPNSDSKAAAEQAARLCKQVRENPIEVENHKLNITISIGIAQFKNDVDTWESLLNRADTAMYEAKNKGRDGWFVIN